MGTVVSKQGSVSTRRRWLARACWPLVAGGTFTAATALAQTASTATKGTKDGGPSPAPPLLTPATIKAIRAGLTFLKSRQNADGSTGAGDYSRNVAVCSLVGMAWLASGSTPERGPFAPQVSRTLDFILAQAVDSGLVVSGDASGREPMYGHGFATLFLAEVYGTTPRESLRDRLSAAVQLILQSQNAAGGWRYEPRRHEADVSVTVCQMMALRAARNAGVFVPSEVIDRAVQYLLKAQNADGGFMYMLTPPGESGFPRSAAAVVALMGAGKYETPEVRRGVDYLWRQAPPLKSLAGQSYFLYGHYYAAQALWHAGGEGWPAWYAGIRDLLLRTQQPSGAWDESISLDYSTAMATLILQMPQNYLPIFQR